MSFNESSVVEFSLLTLLYSWNKWPLQCSTDEYLLSWAISMIPVVFTMPLAMASFSSK